MNTTPNLLEKSAGVMAEATPNHRRPITLIRRSVQITIVSRQSFSGSPAGGGGGFVMVPGSAELTVCADCRIRNCDARSQSGGG